MERLWFCFVFLPVVVVWREREHFSRVFKVFTRYGKCYTFNAADDDCPPLLTTKGGMGNGLELMLDIQQDEYLPVWGETGEGRITLIADHSVCAKPSRHAARLCLTLCRRDVVWSRDQSSDPQPRRALVHRPVWVWSGARISDVCLLSGTKGTDTSLQSYMWILDKVKRKKRKNCVRAQANYVISTN